MLHTDRLTAIVTGATGGIGFAVARLLLWEGWNVFVISRTKEALYDLCAGTGAEPIPLDVTCESTEEIIQAALGALPCRLLVTCHGASPVIKPTMDQPIETWRLLYDTDVLGSLRAARAVFPGMRQHGTGAIIFVSSFHALGTYPERAPYATAKAGIAGLARALCCEWAQYGITVNTIAPGQVIGQRTAGIAKRLSQETGTDVLRAMKGRSPAGKLVAPEDIAQTVLWLANTPSVNGQTIVLDHGVTASLWYGQYPAG